MASIIGPLRSNDRFTWMKNTFSIFIHRNAIVLNGKALARHWATIKRVEVCLLALPSLFLISSIECDCFKWKGACQTPGNHQKGQGLFIGVALVLARLFQLETILFRWMKMETTQPYLGCLFIQN